MSLKSALETAKEILEQATTEDVTIEEGMHDKKNGETEAPGLKGGAMSADGVSPEAIKPTDKKAKKPTMQSTDAGAEEEDMHGGEKKICTP